MPTQDPRTGYYYEAQSAEDHWRISCGLTSGIPGCMLVPVHRVNTQEPLPVDAVWDSNTGQWYQVDTAEDAHFVGIGKVHLAVSARIVRR